jgi:hypothetical protein
VNSGQDYKLTSPANRAELIEFNKCIPLIFSIQTHPAKDVKCLSLVTGKGKSLICGCVDDDVKLYVTDFPIRDPNFRNLQYQLAQFIHTMSKFSSLYIPVNIPLRHNLILDRYYTIRSKYVVTAFQEILHKNSVCILSFKTAKICNIFKIKYCNRYR